MNISELRDNLTVIFEGRDIKVFLGTEPPMELIYSVPLKDVVQGLNVRENADKSFETCRDLCTQIKDAIDRLEQ